MAEDYHAMSREGLINLIKQLKSRKKYGLVWEDKPEDVVTRCEEELPVLEDVQDRKVISDDGPTNLIIEGDNYHALSVLNYTHARKVDFIYIDPPYNTGAKDWKYNNDYVDAEDAYRHSKWISFMHHRLSIAVNLLGPTGALVVAIDDYELATLGLLLKELMPTYVQDLIIIEHHPQGAGSNTVSRTHEYAYIMTPVGVGIPNRIVKEESQKWSLRRSGQGENNWRVNRPNQFYAIFVDKNKGRVVKVGPQLDKDDEYTLDEDGGLLPIYPIDRAGKERVWRYARKTMQKLIDEGKIEYTKNGSLVVCKDVVAAKPVFSIWKGSRYNAGTNGSSLLTKIFGDSNRFPYPKSLYNTLDILKLFVGHKQDALVLDFFAGSGTTGHAVLELNKEDGGNRKCILCTNNENGIAEEVTYPRIKKVIEGYADVEGIPANLRYFKTAFVKKSNVSDDTRKNLVLRSVEMICVKENCFDDVDLRDGFKIFKNGNHSTAILFDLDKIDELKDKLNELDIEAHVYVFSLTNDTYDADFADLKVSYKLCPIPESILEVYRKLFA